jgi:hypothetical protein
MMFRPLALLSGIALFTSVARGAYLDVNVSNAYGDLTYTPSQLVSQVPATQPNRHTDNCHSDRRRWGYCSVQFRE